MQGLVGETPAETNEVKKKKYKPKDRSNDVLLRLSANEKHKLKCLAGWDGVSMNEYLRYRIVTAYANSGNEVVP
jgi:hypothetical protein